MQDQAKELRIMANRKESAHVSGIPHPLPVRIIAVTSGKGGVGKTNITANLAIAMAAQNNRVAIIDADLGLANMDVILKLRPKYTIEHVLSGKVSIEDVFIKGPAGLTIIPAGSGVLSLADLRADERAELMKQLIQSTSHFDIVFIDTAAGISRNVVDFAMIAREVLVVTTPEPTAITDAYAVVKVISQLKRKRDEERSRQIAANGGKEPAGHNQDDDDDLPIGIVVNMVDSIHQAEEVAERIILAARQFVNAQAHFAGYVLSDTCVTDSVFSQRPLVFEHPESSAAQCINLLAAKLLNYEQHK